MDISVDATADGRASATAPQREIKLKVRTQPRISALRGDVDCQISPSSPLVSTSLDENGWVCGKNRHGQLGVGGAVDVAEPRPLRAPRRWAQLSLGGAHAVAVTARGEAFSWGLNDLSQLGDPLGPGPGAREPKRMELLVGWNVRGVAAGGSHSVAWTGSDVITWGGNGRGQCGHGERAERDWVKPRAIKALHDLLISAVACGDSHSLCVTGTSMVFAWGRNSEGQLGLGDRNDRRAPARVDALWALPVVALAAGARHSCALTGNGSLFTWGDDSAGQLGLPAAAPAAAAAAAARPDAERRRVSRRVNQRFLGAMLDMGIPRDAAELALHETGNVGVEVAAEWLFSVPQDLLDAHLAGDPGTPHDDAELHGAGVDAAIALQQQAQVALEGGGGGSGGRSRGGASGAAPSAGAYRASLLGGASPSLGPSAPHAGATAAAPVHGLPSPPAPLAEASGGSARSSSSTPRLLQRRSVTLPRRVALQGVRCVSAGDGHTLASGESETWAWGTSPSGALALGPDVGTEPGRPAGPQAIAALAGVTIAALSAGAEHSLFLAADGQVFGSGDASALPGGSIRPLDPSGRVYTPARLHLAFLSPHLEEDEEAEGEEDVSMLDAEYGGAGDAGAEADSACDMDAPTASAASAAFSVAPLDPTLSTDLAPSSSSQSFEDGDRAGSVGRRAAAGDRHGQHRHHQHGRSHLAATHTPAAAAATLSESHTHLSRPARVSVAVAGLGCSAFLTRGADEPAPRRVPRLWERLAAAAAAARAAPREETDARLRPLAAAVERVYGSAAAVCAAFGLRDRVGLDAELLESVSAGLLELEATRLAQAGAGEGWDAAYAAGRGSPAARTPAAGRGVLPGPPPASPSPASGASPSPTGSRGAAQGAAPSVSPRGPGAAQAAATPTPLSPAPGSIRATPTAVAAATPHLFEGLRKGAEALLYELERNASLLGTPERALVLLAACQNVLLGDPRTRAAFVPRTAAVVLLAPRAARRLLVRWWAGYPAALLERRVVQPLQRYLTDELYATKKLTLSVMNVIKVLALVEEANQHGRTLPPDAFYNELISEKLDVLDHYVAWRQTHDMPAHAPGADGPFSFCSYPFLLNPRAKSKLLHTEARIQMDQTVAACRAEAAGAGRASTLGGETAGADPASAADTAGNARGPPSPLRGGAAAALSPAPSPTRPAAAHADAADDCVVPAKARPVRRRPPPPTAHADGAHAAAGPSPLGSGRSAPAVAAPGARGSSARTSSFPHPAASHEAHARPPHPRSSSVGHAPAAQPPRASRAPGGLRWLFSSLRAGDGGGPGTPSAADAVVAGAPGSGRSSSTSRVSSPSSTPSSTPREELEADEARRTAALPGGALWRQGSLNLPSPDASGFPSTHPDMCILRVRRNHLLEDALDEIARQKPKDLFKPLRVHFIGEEGIDAGGVKKEFFQLLVAEVLSPDYGMLAYQAESRTYWFSASTLEGEGCFLLLGLVLGLAIYNGVLLDFPLPLALYRKLLGAEVGLRDLEDMQPVLGRSLRQLLTWGSDEAADDAPTADGTSIPAADPAAPQRGSVEDVFCQRFEVEVAGFGETRVVELKPGGSEIPVTEENRREFVDLYVDFFLNKSVHQQFEAFARGFLMLCGGPALQLFSATELERLVCGNPNLDLDALRVAARYEAGYHADHRVIVWLWDVVREFDDGEKRRFLKFFTGSDRAPIGGLGNLRCVVQRDGADSSKLPTSHTCFNTLLLPSYRSREKLAGRLRLAILNAEGFGLE